MAMMIRAATEQDYDDLCALIDQVDALHRESVGDLFQKPRGPVRERDYIQGLIADRSVGLFVAETAGLIVGLLHIVVCESPPIPIVIPRRYAVVDNLVVDQHFRRSGVGRALMEQAHQWASARGATEVELTVYEFNETAIAFYEGLGYTTRSRHLYRSLRA